MLAPTCDKERAKQQQTSYCRSGEVDPEDQGVQPQGGSVQREGDLRGLLRPEGVHLRQTTREN